MIQDIIGDAALLQLARVAGGLDLYVPLKVPMGGPLGVLPLEAQERLARYAGGTRIYVPRLDKDMRRQRDAAIRAAYDAGEPVRDIAMRYGLSERRVWGILGSPSE